MKKSELRVGNVVIPTVERGGIRLPSFETPLVVNSVGSECECFALGTSPTEQANLLSISVADLWSVTLTEKWLLRMGFAKHGGEVWRCNQAMHIKVTSNVPKTQGASYANAWHVSVRSAFLRGINCVHELQNIVFFLTDEELEIK